MHWLARIASLITAGLILFLLAFSLAEGEDNISVIRSYYVNEFPSEVRFALEASSFAEITKITLYYRLQGSSILTYAYPKFQPGTRVRAEYVWNTQTKYIPPGVEISYYWIIEDAAGNKLKTAPNSFAIEDTRFKWQRQSSGKVTIFWYQGDVNFASTLLFFANRALDELSREVGIQLSEPVKIYIYADTKDLLGALEPKAQEWTGGRSFSEVGIIALAVQANPSGIAWAERALPHELSHVVVHQATRNPYGDIPQWLDEGLAMHAEGELEASYRQALNAAIRNGRVISLKSLASNFPVDAELARLSYAESYSIVDFILRNYGRDKMAALLAAFKEGSTYDDALLMALGTDVDGLEASWRASLGVQPLLSPESNTPAAPYGTDPQRKNDGGGGICAGIWQIIGLASAAFMLGVKLAKA